MNEEIKTMEFTKLAGLCGIYAVFYTFCLYKNYSGITYPLFAIGSNKAGAVLYDQCSPC